MTIIVNADDYAAVIAEMDANQNSLSFDSRFNLAIKAFEHTAQYDGMIAQYFGARLPQQSSKFPRTFNTQLQKKQDLRYGENSHQQAAFMLSTNQQKHQSPLRFSCRVKNYPLITLPTLMPPLSV